MAEKSEIDNIYEGMTSFDNVVIESLSKELKFETWAVECKDFQSLSNPKNINIWKNEKPAFWVLLYLNFYTWLLRRTNIMDIEVFILVAVCAKTLIRGLQSHMSKKKVINDKPSVSFATAKKIADRMFKKELAKLKECAQPKKAESFTKNKFLEYEISQEGKQMISDHTKIQLIKRQQESTPAHKIYLDEPLDLLLYPESEIKGSQDLCLFLFSWRLNAKFIKRYMNLIKNAFITENAQ